MLPGASPDPKQEFLLKHSQQRVDKTAQAPSMSEKLLGHSFHFHFIIY